MKTRTLGIVAVVLFAPGACASGATAHLGVEPWCTYTLPHKMTGGEFSFTEMFTTVTLALDKAASFGSCAATREMSIRVTVEQLSEQFPYEGEVVG